MDAIDNLARQLAAQAIQSAIDTVNRAFDGATGKATAPRQAVGGTRNGERSECARQMRREHPEMTTTAIASAVGLSQSAAHQAIQRWRPWGRPRIDDTDPISIGIRRLHGLGMNDTEIAKAIGCYQSTVSRRRHRMGLPALSHGGRPRKTAEVAPVVEVAP